MTIMVERISKMFTFLKPLTGLAEYESAKRWLSQNEGVYRILGCAESQKLHMAYMLAQDYPYHLIITDREQRAKELYEEYSFLDKEVLLYPAKDFIFYAADIQGSLLLRQRLEVLKTLSENKGATVITTIDGCMDCIQKLECLKENIIRIDMSSVVDVDALSKRLARLGYERTYQVEAGGQFSVRGGIIDIFSLTESNPFRIELWGDEIDSIRSFDVMTQRSIENLDE